MLWVQPCWHCWLAVEFCPHLPRLAAALDKLSRVVQVDEDSFGRVKEALLRKYRNANMNVDRHATYARLRALKHIWEVDEVLAELEGLQPSHIQVCNHTLPSPQEDRTLDAV